jgi:hypothetical protein
MNPIPSKVLCKVLVVRHVCIIACAQPHLMLFQFAKIQPPKMKITNTTQTQMGKKRKRRKSYLKIIMTIIDGVCGDLFIVVQCQ